MRSFLIALAIFGLLAGISNLQPTFAAVPKKGVATKSVPAAKKTTKAQYECGMCHLMTAKGGKCPKCGMQMAKIDAKKAATAKYECTMCGIMTAKAGKCPKCGMKMTKMRAKPAKG